MAKRGKGFKSRKCHCKLPSCGKTFLSCREDATTCCEAHRKALNRLLGGSRKRKAPSGDGDNAGGRKKAHGVTTMPNAPDCYRVLLDGKHIATKPTQEEAERLVAGWLETFDGEFTIEPRPASKGKR